MVPIPSRASSIACSAHADPGEGELEAMVAATRALVEGSKVHSKRPVPKAPAAAAAAAT